MGDIHGPADPFTDAEFANPLAEGNLLWHQLIEMKKWSEFTGAMKALSRDDLVHIVFAYMAAYTGNNKKLRQRKPTNDRRAVKVGRSLRELAEADVGKLRLAEAVKSLRNSGANEVYLASVTEGDVMVEVTTADVARILRSAIVVKGRRVVATDEIDWQNGFAKSLDRVVSLTTGFDKVGRFRFAATDMRLAADSARALIAAEDEDGPARMFDRVLETGTVVTYARPFLDSNEAPLGQTWWPNDEDDRRLHNEILELRHEYHAHAAHTSRRRLENVNWLHPRAQRPMWAESWETLPTHKLRSLIDLAERQARDFAAEADRLDVELFGPGNA